MSKSKKSRKKFKDYVDELKKKISKVQEDKSQSLKNQ